MIIKKSAPFALLALIMSFYSRIDPVLIERILGGVFGSEQVVIFAQGYRLLDAGQNFVDECSDCFVVRYSPHENISINSPAMTLIISQQPITQLNTLSAVLPLTIEDKKRRAI